MSRAYRSAVNGFRLRRGEEVQEVVRPTWPLLRDRRTVIDKSLPRVSLRSSGTSVSYEAGEMLSARRLSRSH